MDVTVYIDVYFLVNFVMDFIILFIVSKIKKTARYYPRLIGASVAGGLISCVVFIMNGSYQVFCMILGYIVAPIGMALIAFGYGSLDKLLSTILYQYTVTIMLGGLLNCIFYNFLCDRKKLGIFGRNRYAISLVILFGTVFVILLLLPRLIHYFYKFQKRENHIYTVSLTLNGNKIEAKGLCDTGNHLREPLSNKPVIIAERTLLNRLMENELFEYATRVKAIPYRTIGKEHGMMYAIVIDEMCVLVDEEKHEHKGVVTCIYEGTLSSKKDYQLILHEELL